MARYQNGTMFLSESASGLAQYRILRPHRTAGFYETVLVKWLGGYGLKNLQSLKGSIQVFPRAEISAGIDFFEHCIWCQENNEMGFHPATRFTSEAI